MSKAGQPWTLAQVSAHAKRGERARIKKDAAHIEWEVLLHVQARTRTTADYIDLLKWLITNLVKEVARAEITGAK